MTYVHLFVTVINYFNKILWYNGINILCEIVLTIILGSQKYTLCDPDNNITTSHIVICINTRPILSLRHWLNVYQDNIWYLWYNFHLIHEYMHICEITLEYIQNKFVTNNNGTPKICNKRIKTYYKSVFEWRDIKINLKSIFRNLTHSRYHCHDQIESAGHVLYFKTF